MKIGLFTDSLTTSFSEALDWVVEHGIEAVEVGTGNFSPAAHCNLDELLLSEEARTVFKSAIESRGLVLSALNCNGNLLDPHPARGQASQDVFFKTVELAHRVGLDTDRDDERLPWRPEWDTLSKLAHAPATAGIRRAGALAVG